MLTSVQSSVVVAKITTNQYKLHLTGVMSKFSINNFVRIRGLSEQHNGALGQVKSRLDLTTGQHIVELQPVEGRIFEELNVDRENLVRACDGCHLAETSSNVLRYCDKCKNAKYCNKSCQTIHWSQHKEECEAMKEQRYMNKARLFAAAESGRLREVQFHVQCGLDESAHNALARVVFFRLMGVALWLAADQGHLPVVQYLVEQGVDKEAANSQGSTALMFAAHKGHLAIVQYLIQQGANRDHCDESELTALMMAIASAHMPVVQYLVQQGADINYACPSDGGTPLMMAAVLGELSIVKFLVKQGANINQPAFNGRTPLAGALVAGQTAVADYLRAIGGV